MSQMADETPQWISKRHRKAVFLVFALGAAMK
jgi:hypothetical protein